MSTTQTQQMPDINDTRWKIGWNPFLTILALTIVGAALGYWMSKTGETTIIVSIIGAIVGIVLSFWGALEVNEKYIPLLKDFRETTQNRVRSKTGGLNVQSYYNFFNSTGKSPLFIRPNHTYHITHIIMGNDSVIINKEFQYDLEDRTGFRGGEQSELFYDQISNIRSMNFKNDAMLELSLSSGQVIEIPSRDPEGVEKVKTEIQQYMRDVRQK